MSADTGSHHRQLRSASLPGFCSARVSCIVFFKVVTAVEALTPPALLSGRIGRGTAERWLLTPREEGHDTRPL